MQKTQKAALTAVFAALHVILYLPDGPWRSFVIYLIPIEGIVLGPAIGSSAALLGGVTARLIKPDILWMFGIIAEPIGVFTAGFLAKGRWMETTAVYGFMLIAYFSHPYGRMLPLWTILDLLIAFILIYPVSKVGKRIWTGDGKSLPAILLLIAFISTVADSMTRVFLLIPGGLYHVFGLSYDTLAYGWFIPGAVGSYIEDLLVAATTLVAGVPLLMALQKILHLHQPLS